MRRAQVVPVVVLVVASAALGVSIAWAGTRDGDADFGMMRFGAGMMGYSSAGSGEPVHDLSGAKRQAERFAQRLDLRVGEVMRFDNHYYAELVGEDERAATEVLVDPDDGTVMLEPGPGMMWNTRYGMMLGDMGMMGDTSTRRGSRGSASGGMMGDPSWTPLQARGASAGGVTAAEARKIASRWLRDADPRLGAGDPESFPGYFTLHTMQSGRIDGMLSVNASTGTVWYHWWHGRFIEMSE